MDAVRPMDQDVTRAALMQDGEPGNPRYVWIVWLVSTVAIAVAIGILALTPVPAMPRNPMFSDKIAHMLAFLAVVFPTAALWPRAIAWAGLLAVIYGGVIEVIQPFTGRSAELGDLLADGIGVGLGIILGSSLRWYLGARRAPRSG